MASRAAVLLGFVVLLSGCTAPTDDRTGDSADDALVPRAPSAPAEDTPPGPLNSCAEGRALPVSPRREQGPAHYQVYQEVGPEGGAVFVSWSLASRFTAHDDWSFNLRAWGFQDQVVAGIVHGDQEGTCVRAGTAPASFFFQVEAVGAGWASESVCTVVAFMDPVVDGVIGYQMIRGDGSVQAEYPWVRPQSCDEDGVLYHGESIFRDEQQARVCARCVIT